MPWSARALRACACVCMRGRHAWQADKQGGDDHAGPVAARAALAPCPYCCCCWMLLLMTMMMVVLLLLQLRGRSGRCVGAPAFWTGCAALV